MVEPVMIDTFLVKKTALENVGTWAGLDRGCSLTKFLYVPKEDANKDSVTLVCVTFRNTDFEGGIDYLTQRAFLPEEGEICVTGVGCDKYRDLIEKKTKLTLRFVDEMFTVIKGPHFLMKNFTTEAICYPETEEELKPQHSPLDGLMKHLAECTTDVIKDIDPEPTFPAIFVTLGSAAGLTMVRETGQAVMIGGTITAGKTFMGLSHLLLGTSNYSEIMKLAEKGNLGELTLLVKDNHTNDPDSPYGIMDLDMPLIPFGNVKPGDSLANKKKEDVAISLVNFMVCHLLSVIIEASVLNKVTRIYIGGNMARSPIFRHKMRQQNEILAMNRLSLHFVKTGHTGAIGAMLTKPGEDEQFNV